jgi:hypothetical protein
MNEVSMESLEVQKGNLNTTTGRRFHVSEKLMRGQRHQKQKIPGGQKKLRL